MDEAIRTETAGNWKVKRTSIHRDCHLHCFIMQYHQTRLEIKRSTTQITRKYVVDRNKYKLLNELKLK